MYLNQFELTGIPEFFSKGMEGLGEFYYLDGTLSYFPYQTDKNGHVLSDDLQLPKDEAGNLLEITAKGFYHSEECPESITCYDCGTEFDKVISFSFITITSFHLAEPEIYLGNEKALSNSYGMVAGDVQSVREIEGRERSFYIARIAIRDTTATVGYSYINVSSLHPFTVDKGDRLFAKGKLLTTQRGLNALCPNCSCMNTLVNDSTVLQASAVQSMNSPKAYFGDIPLNK